jgi:hypothetical protein
MASHRAVKKHAYKELVVVKSNAVSYPGTVVIHFKNAAVALAAVVASVRLGFETPLADAHTAKLFLFNRNDNWWGLRLLRN